MLGDGDTPTKIAKVFYLRLEKLSRKGVEAGELRTHNEILEWRLNKFITEQASVIEKVVGSGIDHSRIAS